MKPPPSPKTPAVPPEPARPEGPPVGLSAEPPASQAVVNILIVDDEVRNLNVLESILYAPGYRLVRASSANEALLALVDGEFAVLVLDINMPGMNGIELANLIKQRKRTQHIPILFLTAYYQDEKYVLEGYGVGAVDYMTKPVNPAVLRAKVAVFVDLHRLHLALTESNAALAREIAQRQAAEESLRRVNYDLEARVQQRTNELTAANAALREGESQLRLVADHASVYLAHVDQKHRFRFVNRAYATRFGLSPDEIIGEDMARIMGPTAYTACRRHLDQALTGERVEFEIEIADDQRGSHWLHIVYEPERSAEGDVSGVVAVLVDITARKRAEIEMIRARDEAMAASRAKDDFLAALSHELRTPLNPVLLVASAAASDDTLPTEVREDFSCIARNALLEARLIDDLLDLTRITRGKVRLELKPVDVHAVLRDAIAAIQYELQEKQIEFQVAWGLEDAHALADDARLQQVFWNVLKNAVKFTPARGRVTVTTALQAEKDDLTVMITDNGIGMMPEELARVFQPFTQGDHAAGGAHRYGGLGLGLAISQLLMELHGGSVQALSQGRDQGSTFIIRIPRATDALREAGKATAAAKAEAAPLPPSGAAARSLLHPILLVEDHEPTRAVLAHLLGQRHYQTVATDTLAGARRLAASQRFSFVISDLGLPDGTGYELMEELRARYGLQGIALSGYGMEQDVARSRASGFIGHLTKPVTFAMIQKMIDELYAPGAR